MSCACKDELAERLEAIHKEKLREAMKEKGGRAAIIANAAWAYLEAAAIVRGEK